MTMAGQQTYPITGIPVVPTQPIPTRQEITSWYGNGSGYQVSLFMQALTAFKEVPVEERLSYFQVAGIHCYPLVGWDGEAGVKNPEVSSDLFPGYCAHNRVTFPLWHRPYMLLFEQVLWETMNSIIDNWKLSDSKDEEKWREAANQWRLPYWDWAIPQPYINNFGVPEVCTYEDITISMPYGKTQTIENPLKQFSNPKKDAGGSRVPMGDPSMGVNAIKYDDPNVGITPPRTPRYHILPWNQCVGTSRYGITDEYHDLLPPKWVAGINNWKGANLGIQEIGWYMGDTTPSQNSSLNSAVSRMLSPGYFSSFELFASTKWNGPTKTNTNYLSIEYIHNVVHNMTGGQFISSTDINKGTTGYLGLGVGHMCDVPVAAFDPIFWLHHCNIDRLFAIWQTFNDNWFDDPNPPPPNPNKLPPDPVPSDPLLPFHYDKNKNCWNSDMARYWKKLGYQYDILVPQAGVVEGSPQYLTELRTTVNELYPPPSTFLKQVPGYLDSNDKYSDYIINVVYDRYALKGLAYSILFFIGAPPKDLHAFRASKNFVGMVFTFSSPTENADGTPKCGNCVAQSEAKVLSKAQIPLTIPLVAKVAESQRADFGDGAGAPDVPQAPIPGVEDLKPEVVEALLRDEAEGLSWVFVALGGDQVDKAQFPDTQVAVLHGQGCRTAELDATATSGKAFRGYKVLKNAVSNQPLGLGHPDSGPDMIVDDEE